MALEEIIDAIAAEADEAIRSVRAEAAEEAAAILERGREEAAAAEASLASSRDDDAVQRRARIVNRARLDVERRLRAAAEEVYVELRAEVEHRLADQRATPGYPELFRRLLEECRAVLPDGRVVRTDPADAYLARHCIGDVDGFVVVADLESIGGVELTTEDGRRSVRNTLESRLERANRPLRTLAADMVPVLLGAP